MESQRQVPLRKKDRLGFVGKNLAVVSSVQRTKDIHFNEPSKPGEAPMSNSRFAMNIVSLQDFVFSKTYRKRATDNCGNRGQMPIVLRYVDSNKEINESFIKYVHCKEGLTGLALSANIENALKEVGLLLENCRGQGYDGVSAMSSESKSVSGRILQQNPKALMVVISL